MRNILLLLLCFFAPCLVFAQTEGEEVFLVQVDSLSSQPVKPDSVVRESVSKRLTQIIEKLSLIGFDDSGIIPKKRDVVDDWEHVPKECHIDWHRKRERPLIDFCYDLIYFFNTVDTTFIERNRYNFRVMAQNTDFFSSLRLAAREEKNGVRQIVNIAPDHSYKIGPRAGWRALVLGYTFGVVPSSKHKASEFNVTLYNSRLGFDLNWQHSSGPYSLRRAKGFTGLTDKDVRGMPLSGITTNNIALNAYYVFNYRHFSYPAAYSASTVQLKSAGSWFLGVNYNRQHLSFDPDNLQTIIEQAYLNAHPEVAEQFGTSGAEGIVLPKLYETMRVQNVNYKRIGASIGYAYTWVPIRNLQISASAAPSLGVRKQHGEVVSTEMIVNNLKNFHVDFIFRSSVIYNKQRWFAGASAVTYLYDYRHDMFDLTNTNTYLRIFLGVQINKRRKFRVAGQSHW